VSYLNPETSAPRADRIGRPRDAVREAEILRQVLVVLGSRGYESLTFEEVARRANASKATLYRRWATKREMVVAAVKAGPAAAGTRAVIDTGSLRGDLLALCSRLVSTLRSADGSMSLMLLQAGIEDPELCRHLEHAAGPTGARLPQSVLEAAVRRGELPDNAQSFAYDEVAGSVLLLRRLNGLTLDEAYLQHLVDAILIPALAAPCRNETLPAGIFSGEPTPA
jgi:AcrR family transcriptional regulator